MGFDPGKEGLKDASALAVGEVCAAGARDVSVRRRARDGREAEGGFLGAPSAG